MSVSEKTDSQEDLGAELHLYIPRSLEIQRDVTKWDLHFVRYREDLE